MKSKSDFSHAIILGVMIFAFNSLCAASFLFKPSLGNYVLFSSALVEAEIIHIDDYGAWTVEVHSIHWGNVDHYVVYHTALSSVAAKVGDEFCFLLNRWGPDGEWGSEMDPLRIVDDHVLIPSSLNVLTDICENETFDSHYKILRLSYLVDALKQVKQGVETNSNSDLLVADILSGVTLSPDEYRDLYQKFSYNSEPPFIPVDLTPDLLDEIDDSIVGGIVADYRGKNYEYSSITGNGKGRLRVIFRNYSKRYESLTVELSLDDSGRLIPIRVSSRSGGARTSIWEAEVQPD